jgi:hypothetical protein
VSVKYIRCDNAGENGSLDRECAKQGLGIQFEYTGPGMPQFNGRVKRKFTTLYSKVRAMLNGAKLPTVKREGLWTEAARTATDLENILVSTGKPIASYNALIEKELPGLRTMGTFGEIAIVNDLAKRKMRGKRGDRGRPCILLGRAENHHRDVYRFLNLETKQIIRSRNALWLNKQYGVWKGISKPNVTNIDDDKVNEPFLDLSRKEFPNIKNGRETESPNIETGRETADVNQIEVFDANDNPVPPKLTSAMQNNRIYAITRILRALSYACSATDNDRNKQLMATADGDVETKAYFRKYPIAIKLSLTLAAQQATRVVIHPKGYCCSRATLLSSNRINDILTD